MKIDKKRNIDKLRSYSTVFSSTSFARLLKYDDYSFINAKILRYDQDIIGKAIKTYADYIEYIYKELRKEYRNEYIYKNTLINDVLIKSYGLKNTVVINEFKVGNSVADIVMFNGTSKVFEIKTELDSSKRLDGQMSDYSLIFNERYIVTNEELVDKYLNSDDSIGIIELSSNSGSIKMKEYRSAVKNKTIDYNAIIRSLRTEEYKNIVKNYYTFLPEMTSFNMFDICSELIKKIPQDQLNQLFIEQIKSRKSNTQILNKFNKELRQIGLALKLNQGESIKLHDKLNKLITVQ